MMKFYPPKIFFIKHPLFTADINDTLEIESLFQKAVAESSAMTVRPANEVLLRLYALYKQSMKGDIDIAPPDNSCDCLVRSKYDAWAALKGTTIKEAQSEYIMLVYKLKN